MITETLNQHNNKGIDVTPSYSRSGGRVYQIEDTFFVPRIDSQYPEKYFDSLADAWSYCESAYYSYL